MGVLDRIHRPLFLLSYNVWMKKGKKMPKINVEMEGKSYEYHCDEHVTLLEQALKESISLPFSCMAGACTTCQAHLVSGRVEMEDHSSLDEEDIEAGQILTCQAMPRSDVVHIKVESP